MAPRDQEFDPGDKMRRMSKGMDDPTPLLKRIGALMVSESQQSFRAQKFGDKSWRPRSVPNVYGLIADFHKGSKPPGRRTQERPVLTDTGRLAQSIAFKITGRSVVVGSNLDYAATLHAGGAIESKPITKKVQELLGKWLKRSGKPYADKLGKYLSPEWEGKTIKGEVEPRPFVGITKHTREDIEETIRQFFREGR